MLAFVARVLLLGVLLADLPSGGALDGLEEFGAVPDLQDAVRDVDVDAVAGAVHADADLLPGNGDDAVGGDEPGDPLIAGPVLGKGVQDGLVAVGGGLEEPAARGGDAQGLVRPVVVVGGNPGVELGLGAGQGGGTPCR